MKKIKYSLLSGVLALSAASGVISAASSKKDITVVSATSLSTLATRKVVWSDKALSDTNFEWSALLRERFHP